MSVIPFASVSLKTMADGTLRISVDIEPAHAQDAFKLFASPGTPGAMTALKAGYAQKTDTSPKPVSKAPEIEHDEKPKIGPLAYWLVMRCGEQEFWSWLVSLGYKCQSAHAAGVFVKSMLGVESRKQIDGNPELEEAFHRVVRGPYSRWCAARGVTA